MNKDIIDFAVWYSGMDRIKVENAYKRYIKEVIQTSCIHEWGEIIHNVSKCKKCGKYSA
jgi:hypothetical protein